ncbi:MAG TPA: CRISPR-associated endonuclease Cas1 [Flexilinea sp.]|nr:CRISPR-associated endonuclease Cas1 [Flexilinea sp.]HRY21716.1 CRISPR-associated endonuclease Cas1 [Flexilinea sp.]
MAFLSDTCGKKCTYPRLLFQRKEAYIPPIYIVEQGTKIRIHNRCVQIEKENDGAVQVLCRSPIGTVSQIVIFGNIGLTTPAIGLFLEENIDVVFLSVHGEFRGRLATGLSPHIALRKAQYHCLDEPEFVLDLSIQFVRAKLQHQKALLQRHNRDLKFQHRKKRPSPDPINAILSFGYTLLAQNAVSAVQVVGLDPFAGFLHSYAYNRASLGMDLMEEFRPIVDGVALWCCRGGQIAPQDFCFDDPNYPCLMNDRAKKVLITAFENRMDSGYTHPLTKTKLSMRQCMIEQARQIAEGLRKYPQPFRWVPMGFR